MIEFTCPYCGRVFKYDDLEKTPKARFKYHVNRCPKNPNKINEVSHKIIYYTKQDIVNEIIKKQPDIDTSLIEDKLYTRLDTITLICHKHNKEFHKKVSLIFRQKYICKKCALETGAKNRAKLIKQEKRNTFINKVKEINPNFLKYFDIDLSDWDGGLRNKIKVICKKCGNIFYKLPEVILSSKSYECDGCNFIKQSGFPKLQMSINDLSNWVKENKPKFYDEFKIIDTYHVYIYYKATIKLKCKKCGDIFDYPLRSICNDRKSILCKKCKNETGDINDLLEYISKKIN